MGIGWGPVWGGQVRVVHDMVGYGGGHPPRSVKQYAQLHDPLVDAFRSFAKDVTEGAFPAAENSIAMDSTELAQLRRMLSTGRSNERGETGRRV